MAKRKNKGSGRNNVQAQANSAKTLSTPKSNGVLETSLSAPNTDLKASASLATTTLDEINALAKQNTKLHSLNKSAVTPTSEETFAMQNVESLQNTENKTNSSSQEDKNTLNQVEQAQAKEQDKEQASTQTESSSQQSSSTPSVSLDDAKATNSKDTSASSVTSNASAVVKENADINATSSDSKATLDSDTNTNATTKQNSADHTSNGLATETLSSAAQAVSDMFISSTSGENSTFDINSSLDATLTSTATQDSALGTQSTQDSKVQPSASSQEIKSAESTVSVKSKESVVKSEDKAKTEPEHKTESPSESANTSITKNETSSKTVAEALADNAAKEATDNPLYATPEQLAEMGEMDEGTITDFSALVAEANGASIMNDAVLSNDGHTAIMGLENLQNTSKPKVNTHIIIGPNNERIISPMPEEEEVVAPTPPKDLGFVQRLAEINAKKAEEAERDAIRTAKRKEERAKELANSQPVFNQTSKSLDDFDFGQERSRETRKSTISVPENSVVKDLPQSSGMGNGIVSNILDNKDPFAGRENQPHDKFGSAVSDFDNPRLTQAEIARSRARLALAQDNLNQELEYERLKQRGKERREREEKEAQRREQERQRLEAERFEQEKERRRQERQQQAAAQNTEQGVATSPDMNLPQQELEGDAYVGLTHGDNVTNYNQPYASYADTSDYEGIVAPISEDTPQNYEGSQGLAPNTNATFNPAAQDKEDSAPTYMVGNINRPQKEIVHTAMFVQGDGEEPSPYVCGVNARRLSDSDLRKFQQKQAQAQSGQASQDTSFDQGFASEQGFATNQPRMRSLAFNDEADGMVDSDSYYDQARQAQGYTDFNEGNASMTNVGANDFKLQPGFGENLNFNGNLANPNLASVAPPQGAYAGQYDNASRDSNFAPHAPANNDSAENIYWTPGQSTADFQASIANQQQRRMQQEQSENYLAQDASTPQMANNPQGGMDDGIGQDVGINALNGMDNSLNGVNGPNGINGLNGANSISSAPSEEERTEPLPAGMGDGVLALNGGNEQQSLTAAAGIDSSLSQQDTGPVYMVGPSRPTNQRNPHEEEDDGPLYAVGPDPINAKVEAKLKRMNMRIASNSPSMPQPLSPEELIDNEKQAEDEKALAEAARESVAAPQSEVIKRGRQLAAQVSAETLAANANQNSFNDVDFIADENELSNTQGVAFSEYQQGPSENYALNPALNPELSGQEVVSQGQFAQGQFVQEQNTGFEYERSAQSGFKSALNAEMDNTQTTLDTDLVSSQDQGVANEHLYEAPISSAQNQDEHQEPVGFGLMTTLYLRQLVASFFTHTTLPTFFPHAARKLGPCYPSSMAIPFFFVGLIAAMCGRGLAAVSPLHDGSGLTFLVYLGLTGLAAYRGFYRIGAYFNRHRRDVVLLAASVCVPMACFIWLTSSLFTSTIGIAEPTLAFAFASMLSAASASTLSWNVQQDPIDSCGSMTTKGVLLVIVFCFMAAFGLLHYIVGFSVLGVTFIMRLAFGFVISKNHGTAHRSYINALQLLTFFAILVDLTLLKGQGYDLLSTSTLDLVRYIDHLL